MSTYNIADFGAKADGTTDNAVFIQAAIDACHNAGGGRVVIPSGGVHVSGAFALKSHVELHLENGATIQCAADIRLCQEHAGRRCWSFIRADGAQGIAITGGGTIDGNGRAYMEELRRYIHNPRHQRPHTVLLIGCTNVSIRDVVMRDGANWSLRMVGCEDVVVHAIRILNDLRLPNCDGIDPDHCRNVRISDCHIEAGDDCICIKARQEFPEFGPCENITVTGCTLKSTSCAIMVGIEAQAVMRNIVFDSCVIQSSHRGLGVHLSEECDVENVLFSNMVVETRRFHEAWWGGAEPIYVCAHPERPGKAVGTVRNVRFSNILCRSENGVVILGTQGISNVEDLLLENVKVELDAWSRWPGGTLDRRPSDDSWQAGVSKHGNPGFLIMDAKRVSVRNCEVSWRRQDLPEYYTHALEACRVDGLELQNFRGMGARPDVAPISLTHVLENVTR